MNAKLLADAMALPEAEREELAAKLLDSLEPPPGALSIDDEAELQRRAEEARRGQLPGVPWEDLRRKLGV